MIIYKMLEIGLVEPFDAFFKTFKVLSKLEIFEFGFISIMAEDTDNKLKLLSMLNLSFAIKRPFSLSFFEYRFSTEFLNSI